MKDLSFDSPRIAVWLCYFRSDAPYYKCLLLGFPLGCEPLYVHTIIFSIFNLFNTYLKTGQIVGSQ